MVRNNNFKFPFGKDWDWSWLGTRFGNSILLRSQSSHLDTPGYMVGCIIAKDNKVTMYYWEIKDLLSKLSKRGGSTLVNV